MKANKNYPWIVVGLLWVVALLNYMDRQMLSTMQEAIKADIVELNKAKVFGALMAIFMWVYGSFSPFAGVIADKLSRKWLVVGSLFVWSAVTLSMGFATNFETLYMLRALMGISPLHTLGLSAYHRLAHGQIALVGYRCAHDGLVCWPRIGWIWGQFSSPFLVALHLFRPRFDRCSLFVGVDVLASRKPRMQRKKSQYGCSW